MPTYENLDPIKTFHYKDYMLYCTATLYLYIRKGCSSSQSHKRSTQRWSPDLSIEVSLYKTFLKDQIACWRIPMHVSASMLCMRGWRHIALILKVHLWVCFWLHATSKIYLPPLPLPPWMAFLSPRLVYMVSISWWGHDTMDNGICLSVSPQKNCQILTCMVGTISSVYHRQEIENTCNLHFEMLHIIQQTLVMTPTHTNQFCDQYDLNCTWSCQVHVRAIQWVRSYISHN